MVILQNVLTSVGCLLAICSMFAAAKDDARVIVFGGPAMLALIFGYGGTEPFTAPHASINDMMIGVVIASIIIRLIRVVKSAEW